MLRPTIVRFPTRRKPFLCLSSPLSSNCTGSTTPRIAHSITRQRRDSSSKPSSSSPPNESSPVTPETTSPRKKGTFSKAGSRVKTKYAGSVTNGTEAVLSVKEETYAIPRVESTQHLHLNDVHLASLFAFHRPISVQSALPQSISNKRFGQIFTPKPTPPKQYGDVISTISSTVSNILKDIDKNSDSRNVARVVISDSNANANLYDKNGKDPNYVTQEGIPVYIDIDAMVRSLPPFQAPPVPKKASSKRSRPRIAKAVKMEEFFTPSSMNMVDVYESELPITIRETPIQPFLKRMYKRQMGFMERRREIMHAISVKRQRRAKMKKHKLQKLRKRTRNLRRRQDRL